MLYGGTIYSILCVVQNHKLVCAGGQTIYSCDAYTDDRIHVMLYVDIISIAIYIMYTAWSVYSHHCHKIY